MVAIILLVSLETAEMTPCATLHTSQPQSGRMNKYRVIYKDGDGITKTSTQVAATPEAAEGMVRAVVGFEIKILETRKVKG